MAPLDRADLRRKMRRTLLRFAYPALLWLCVLLPILWWLVRPVRPRWVVESPHLRLWQRARDQLGRRLPRLRGIRFVLAVLTAVALIAAGSAPLAFGRPGRTRLVLVFDRSPSMTAVDGPGGATRLADALAKARALLREVPPWTAVRVLGCDGAGARVLYQEQQPRTALDAFLAGLEPGSGSADLRVLAPEDWRPDDQLVLYSDGAGATQLPGRAWQDGAALSIEVVGQERSNTGIAGLRVRDHWPLPELDLEVVVVHAGEAPKEVELLAGPDGAELPLAKTLVAGQSLAPVRATVPRGRGGRFVVRLGGRDVFARDDAVHFAVPPLRAPRMALLAGEGPGRATLRAIADSLAEEATGAVLPEVDAAQADLVLVDGGRLPTPPARGRAWLCFGTRIPGITADDARPLPDPVLADWNRSHPLLLGIDLSSLRLSAALPMAAGGDLPLLLGDRGPLALLRAEPRALCFGFTLADSTLPTLPEFPRLLRRALAHLLGADAAVTPVVEGLLDLHESRIAPAPPRPPVPPIVWARPEVELSPWLGLLALLLWTVRTWLRP